MCTPASAVPAAPVLLRFDLDLADDPDFLAWLDARADEALAHQMAAEASS